MVYLHWLSPVLGQGPGPRLRKIACMVLSRAIHTAPEQGQGRIGYVPIFQVLKLFQVVWYFNGFQVASRDPIHSQCERFPHNVPDPVPILVPDTASVVTL